MSTRRGQFIKLKELLNKAVERASKINSKSAEAVGIGAIKYRTLSLYRQSDVVFDWEKMMSLKGDAAPYLQYTYARMKSVLRKSGQISKNLNFYSANTDEEKSIVRQLIYYPDIVERSSFSCETSYLTEYLFKLANKLNTFYEKLPILKAEKNIRESRLALIKAASLVLKSGLGLLGIKTPERM